MFGFPRRSKFSSPDASQSDDLMRWYSPQRHIETVVFVHGILGHVVRSWGRFPKLLAEDKDLPELDILLWGYPTGWFSRHNALHVEGGQLLTVLESNIRPANDIIMVGHSMGGLIILKGLVDRMELGHAQKPPCHAVTWISLYASPLNGVWAAGVFRKALFIPLRLMRTLHKHLDDLKKGPFIEDLMAQVRARIYEPGVDDHQNRRIPIRIIAATRDGAVAKANRDFALSPYRNPAPYQIDRNHRAVKLPAHAGDTRYTVLATDLQKALLRAFKRLCITIDAASATEEDRVVALEEMQKRYRKIIRSRLRELPVPAGKEEDAENELLHLAALFGARRDVPPFDAVNRATIVLKRRHKDWR